MDSFAFVIHPLNPKADVARKYPRLARMLPEAGIHFLSRYWPPLVLSHVTGIRSAATGKEIEGWLLACPLTTHQMLRLPARVVYRKIIQTGRLAERLGAGILGLGAYTSVVGDGGLTIARTLGLPVTTGDSFTVSLGIQALLQAGKRVGLDVAQATVAVVGATGAIGSACARVLAPQVERLLLVGRRVERLQQVEQQVRTCGGKDVLSSTSVEKIRDAQLVLSATSAGRPIIQPEHLGPGTVVCDVAQPHDVAFRVVRERDDVLVIDGGLTNMPGSTDLGFDYGLPPGITYGCMAETMTLALEGRFENFTVGKDLRTEQVREIETLAAKHGFHLAPFRSFGQPLTDEKIAKVHRTAVRATGDTLGIPSEVV